MRKIPLLHILMTIAIGSAIGQRNSIRMPSLFERPFKDKVVGYRYQVSDPISVYEWEVFASEPSEGVRFMESFKVINVQKRGAIDMYTLRRTDGTSITLPSSKLLLNKQALYDRNTGFKIKGLPVSSLESVKEKIQRNQEDKITFYKKSGGEIFNFDEKASKGLGLWFLYKVEFVNNQEWFLLGRSSEINDNSELTYGWVKSNDILIWNQRIVLQPNQEEGAMKEREEKNVKISAFVDEDAARRFHQKSSNNSTSIIHPNKATKYNSDRLSGQEIRWPILEKEDLDLSSNVFKVGMIGNPRKSGNTVKYDYDQTDIEFAKKKIEDYRKSARNIDIVFVVDRTLSMRPYLDGIKSVLDTLVADLFNQEGGNRYQFGIVAYTDRSENDDEIISFELSNAKTISKYIGEMPIVANEDNTKREALYNGLHSGTQLLSNPTHANFIIHIGDAAGNDPKYKVDILEEMRQKEISLISIQIKNRLHQRTGNYDLAYQEFHTQIKEIVTTNMTNLDRDLRNEAPENVYNTYSESLSSNERLLYIDENLSDDNTTTVVTNKERSPTLGIIKVAHPGKKIEYNELPRMIKDFIIQIEERRKQIFAEIAFVQNQGLEGITYKSSTLNEMENANLTDKQKEEWISKRYTTMIEAFVTFRVVGVTYDLLEFAIFLDEGELEDLLWNIEQLSPQGEISEQRDELKKTWLRILKTYVEPSSEIPISDTLSISYALDKIVGITPSDNILREITIADIGESSELDDDELRDLIDELRTVASELRSDKSFFGFFNLGQRYYWIPRGKLP